MKREWLIKLLKKKGYSRNKLALEVGCSKKTIDAYVSGIRTPRNKLARDISKVLKFNHTKFYE